MLRGEANGDQTVFVKAEGGTDVHSGGEIQPEKDVAVVVVSLILEVYEVACTLLQFLWSQMRVEGEALVGKVDGACCGVEHGGTSVDG